jgi:outer membrane cobalamin receptor
MRFTIVFFMFLSLNAFSQNEPFTAKGRVVDELSKDPIPYATVVIKSLKTGRTLNGTSSGSDGSFEVSSDSSSVAIHVLFIGYQEQVFRDFEILNAKADLGVISLSPVTEMLEAAEVEGEKSVLEFKLDKRVFNVGKDISSSGSSALEVLNNVPSVNVDIEGGVTLRGNSGVQILINGKPSVLTDEGSNALGSISADQIESVEVITNPGSNYQAEGTGGIINIVMKKDVKKGTNGSISVNTGIPDNHSAGLSLNHRTEKFNFFTQLGAGYRSLPRFNESINLNRMDGTEIQSEGTEFRNELFYNATLGADYYLNDLNVITLSGSFAYEQEDQPSETDFSTFTDGVLQESWRREEETEASNPKYQYDLQYKREFKDNEDHTLLFSTLGRFFGKDLSSVFTETDVLGDEDRPKQRTETNFYQRDYTFKLDYAKPFGKKLSAETGALYEYNDVGNEFAVFNESEDGSFVPDLDFTNTFQFDQKVLGVYATLAYELEKWGVKAGLRSESTNLVTLLETTGEENNQNYTNFFPSFHTSYKFSKLFSMQAGYSRRIYRPRLWDLNPFFNIRNNFNIRQGNPELQPEFADSYEITAIAVFEKISINTSIYHLYTTNVSERVSQFVDNVSITMPMNIGSNRKTGFELNGKYTPMKKLVFNGDLNIGFFSRKGEFENQDFSFSGDQWSSRITAKWKMKKQIDLEISGDYNSRVKNVQGVRSGFASMDLGLRKKFWKGKLIMNLSVRDVFASRIRENTIDQSEFYLYSYSRRGRFITFSASYSIGKGEAMQYSGRRR